MDPDVLQPEVAPNVNVPPPAVPDASGLPDAAPLGPPPNVLAGSVQSNGQPPPTENHGNGIVPMIGHAFKSLLSNTDIVYNRDANGNLQAEHVPAQPGSLFKKILAASILGAASSSGPSFGRGVATGGAAALGRNEAQDQQARQRADQDFLARQKVAQEQRENAASQRARDALNLQRDEFNERKVMNQASLAHQTTNELLQSREFALRSQEYLEARQERQNQLQTWLHDNGGELAALPDNGKEGNGSTLMKHLQDNPADMKPPAGFAYQPFSTVNLEGLHKDKDDIWKDKDNNPVDLSARTTWKVYQVPEKILDQPITVTPAQAKKVGVILPENSKGYTVPFSRWVDMNTKHDEIFAKESHEARMSNEANLRSLHLANNEQLLALRQKKDEIKASDLPTNEKNKQLAALGTQIDQISEDNVELVNKLRKSAGIAPIASKKLEVGPAPNQGVDILPSRLADKYVEKYGGDVDAAQNAALKDGWIIPGLSSPRTIHPQPLNPSNMPAGAGGIPGGYLNPSSTGTQPPQGINLDLGPSMTQAELREFEKRKANQKIKPLKDLSDAFSKNQ